MSRLLPPNRVFPLGLLLILLTIGTPVAQAATPGVLITEVMAANTRTVADDRGRYADWIELHNPTALPVSLAGYTLTDDPTEPAKWSLPTATLAPGDFLVVWASGVDQVAPEGWHTSFRLSRGGEYVGLFGPDGQVVDEVTFGGQEADVSLGRLAGLRPVGGLPDSDARRGEYDSSASDTGRASGGDHPGSGRFAGPVTVQLYTPVPGSLLYYTLDGADPTVDGQAYTAPLAVTETTVLRAVALDEGVPVSAP